MANKIAPQETNVSWHGTRRGAMHTGAPSPMLALLMLALLAPGRSSSGPAPGWNSREGTTHYAAFSLLHGVYPQKGGSTLQVVPGPVERGNGGQALFHQGFDGSTEEPLVDINNGYSNVLYDPDDSFGLGKYRVYYSASVKGAGGGIPGESGDSATLYATSADGISWEKPALHRYELNGSTANNILFQGTTAVGIYDDSFHDKNASSRFKMWGNLPGDEWGGGPGVESLEAEEPRLGYTAQLGGTAVSANGLNWTDYRRIQNPSDSAKVKDTLRFDAQASLYFDSRTEKYTGTMRAFRPCDTCGGCPIWWQPHGGCQADVERHKDSCNAVQCNRTVRAIGASFSSSDDFQTTEWGPNEVVQRNPEGPERQFYSQISFPFYNVYLGIVMVFSAMDPPNVYGKGFVHCELSWSADGKNYTRISPNQDFIPRGSIESKGFDSHICFASAHPVKLPNETRIYYMGGAPPCSSCLALL